MCSLHSKQLCSVGACGQARVGASGLCSKHGGVARCAWTGGDGRGACRRGATTVTSGLCTAHGGGKRCLEPGCGKAAAAGSAKGVAGARQRCVAHGGGRRCAHGGCGKAAQGAAHHCRGHGAVLARDKKTPPTALAEAGAAAAAGGAAEDAAAPLEAASVLAKCLNQQAAI
jgi:hypothetical protein